MGVVQLFGQPEDEDSKAIPVPQAANLNSESAEIVELVVNKRIAHGIRPNPVYRQIEAILVSNGVDFSCTKIRSDYKLITYLVQGMLDRSGGVSSDRSLMLDTLRHIFEYEEPVNVHETQELFGDLLGRLDGDK